MQGCRTRGQARIGWQGMTPVELDGAMAALRVVSSAMTVLVRLSADAYVDTAARVSGSSPERHANTVKDHAAGMRILFGAGL